MLPSRTGEHLDAWLVQTKSRHLPELQSFACGREKDKDAVSNGLTWSMNNGPVEGKINKLKYIKRSMYGRSAFPLLRQKVLKRHDLARKVAKSQIIVQSPHTSQSGLSLSAFAATLGTRPRLCSVL